MFQKIHDHDTGFWLDEWMSGDVEETFSIGGNLKLGKRRFLQQERELNESILALLWRCTWGEDLIGYRIEAKDSHKYSSCTTARWAQDCHQEKAGPRFQN